MRTWKFVDGEPYMINPRLGILALQALNPKGHKKMAKHHGARHMAWVRSFRKNAHRKSRKSHRRRNPYPLAGTVAALNPRRHHRRGRKHNPGFSFSRSTLGLPNVQPVLFGAAGFVATAAVQGFVDTLVPANWKLNADGTPNLMTKYGEIIVSIVLVSWAGKMLKIGGSQMLAIGGGIYAIQQAAHDFIPGMIPGMHAYTPLKAYTPLRPSGLGRLGADVGSAGGAFPQLASRSSMRQLAAPVQGFRNSANFADDGGMNVVGERFRRF
jgi:hypothetical protein